MKTKTLLRKALLTTTFFAGSLGPANAQNKSVVINSSDPDNKVCVGIPVTFTATPFYLGTDVNYQWEINGQAVTGYSSSNSFTIANLNDSDRVDVIAVEGLTGDSYTSNIITNRVYEYVTPGVSIAHPNNICYLSTTGFVAVGEHLGTNATYTWRRNGVVIADTTTAEYITSNVSKYYPETFSVSISNINAQCATLDSVSATVTVQAVRTPNPMVAASGTRNICQGSSVTFTNMPNVDSNFLFSWKKNGLVEVGATPSYTATAAGTYVLTVTDPTTGCDRVSSPQVVNVKANPTVNVTVGGPTTFCPGGSVMLYTDSLPGYIVRWKRGGINVDTTASYEAKKSGIYAVTVSKNGCTTTSDPIIIDGPVSTDITVTASGKTTLCGSNTLTLSATPDSNYSYTWYKSATPISNSYTIDVSRGGNYRVGIVNRGCPEKRSVIVPVNSAVAPTADINVVYQGNDYWRLRTTTEGAGITYQWYKDGEEIDGATSSEYDATVNGYYNVIVSNGSCDAQSEVYNVNAGNFSKTIAASNSSNAKLLLYPNPSTGIFNVVYAEPVTAVVRDVQGKIVATVNNATQIDLTNLPAGVYMAQFSNTQGNAVHTQNIMKQ